MHTVNDPQMTFDPTLFGITYAAVPRFTVSKFHENTIMTSIRNIHRKINDLQMTFDLKPVGVTHATLPKDHCVLVHGHTWRYVDILSMFSKLSNKVNELKQPLNDLWFHTNWGQRCDFTKGPLGHQKNLFYRRTDLLSRVDRLGFFFFFFHF